MKILLRLIKDETSESMYYVAEKFQSPKLKFCQPVEKPV